MNKKILVSLTVIGVVAAIVIGGTAAWFSDVEKSEGNTFTAGKLDLIFTQVVRGVKQTVSQPLFNLTDMKPGDTDEVTVNLTVDNNPACGKLTINVTSDYDNTCNEPEIGDEVNCTLTPTGTDEGSGELNDQVNFLIWKEIDCNNVYEGGDETVLVSGPLTGTVAYSIGELPITSAGVCYGIAYCFGDWDETYTTCSGLNVNNSAQTDSFVASLVIDALQKRHQFPDNPLTTDVVEGCPAVGAWPL